MRFGRRLGGFEPSGMRRAFLARCASLVPAMLLGTGAWRSAVASTSSVPTRVRGRTQVNVRDKGARGDGQHDDTSAFQAAIYDLPPAGGTVQVPDGSYLIDAEVSVLLRDHTHLAMSPGARLVAKPNAAERGYVLYAYKVSDVEISGGQIVGDRDRHLGTGGEWGHGIQIRGASRVTVRDIRISDCWGDGICIGGADRQQSTPSEDIVISNVVCTRNRRQGLSIGRSRNVRVLGSEFSDTAGTNPQYGIDIEPDRPGGADDIRIEDCIVRNNRGGGIQIYRRVTNVTITGCTIEGNRGRGILAVTATRGLITNNRIRDNGLVGVALREQTSDYQVRGNHFGNNENRRPRPGKAKRVAEAVPDSAVRVANDSRSIRILDNLYEER
jgi:parallel beta-helix repeat protein